MSPPDDELAARLAEAEARGRDAAKVTSHLEEHDRRLATINGAIGRSAGELAALSRQVATVINQLAQSTALAAQRDEQIRRTNETQVSTRTFVLGLAVLIITIAGLFLGNGHL